MHKLGVQSVAELVRLVDLVLGDTTTALPSDADRGGINRPNALGVMSSALATASARAQRHLIARTTLRHVRREAAVAAMSYFCAERTRRHIVALRPIERAIVTTHPPPIDALLARREPREASCVCRL